MVKLIYQKTASFFPSFLSFSVVPRWNSGPYTISCMCLRLVHCSWAPSASLLLEKQKWQGLAGVKELLWDLPKWDPQQLSNNITKCHHCTAWIQSGLGGSKQWRGGWMPPKCCAGWLEGNGNSSWFWIRSSNLQSGVKRGAFGTRCCPCSLPYLLARKSNVGIPETWHGLESWSRPWSWGCLEGWLFPRVLSMLEQSPNELPGDIKMPVTDLHPCWALLRTVWVWVLEGGGNDKDSVLEADEGMGAFCYLYGNMEGLNCRGFYSLCTL